MTTPIITSVTPGSGWTAGRTLVEIRGSGFRLPTAFDPTIPGIAAKSPQSVRVDFGGVPATNVCVYGDGIIRCLTPPHWPTRWFYQFENNKRQQVEEPLPKPLIPPSGASIVEVSGTISVTITNMDDDGEDIPDESATAEEAYTFVRPRLDRVGTWDRAVTTFVDALRMAILDNVVDDADIDFDVDTGDVAGVTSVAHLPALALTEKVFGDSIDQFEQGVTSETGADGYVIERRPPLYTDFSCDLIGMSVNLTELRAIAQLVRIFFQNMDEILVLKDPDDASAGSYRCVVMLDDAGIQESGRVGNTNLLMFTASVGIIGIPTESAPGVETPGLTYAAALGKPHEGVRGVSRTVETFNVSRTKKRE